MEDWEKKLEKDRQQGVKLWPKYKDRTPSLDYTNGVGQRLVEFIDDVQTVDGFQKTKGVSFRIGKHGNVQMFWRFSRKSQLFLAVNGPLAGKKILDDNPDYVRFNTSDSRFAPTTPSPRSVMVHKDSLEEKEK